MRKAEGQKQAPVDLGVQLRQQQADSSSKVSSGEHSQERERGSVQRSSGLMGLKKQKTLHLTRLCIQIM